MNVSEHYQKIFSRNRQRGIVLDANLLLLIVVGDIGEDRIRSFKRTRKYEPEDYRLVKSIVSFFPRVIVTPNVLTEVSNLLSHLEENWQKPAFQIFQNQIDVLDEIFISSKTVSSNEIFLRLGLTDGGILELGRRKSVVLTDDFPLSTALRKYGIVSVNYNHLRYS